MATIKGTSGNDTKVGTIYDDFITGLAGNDVLYGQAGNDSIDGGTGIDTMYGGTGNDTYVVDSYSDTIIENAGEGIDCVKTSVGYQVNLPANVENLTLLDSGLDIAGYGNDLNNQIQGNSYSNSIYGRAGDDIILGMGNDTVYIEHLWGEDGNDTIYGGDAGLSGIIDGNDDLMGGNGNDYLYGERGNDSLSGDAGDDYLDGGIGNDTMYGGIGNDIYNVDSLSDIVTEYVNQGVDTVLSRTSYTLGSNIEDLELVDGSGAISGTGNNLDNIIHGNEIANSLSGATGNDSIYGWDGNDTIIGGVGSDWLEGGAGNDSYQFSAGAGFDVVADASGTDKISLDGTVSRSNIAIFKDASNNLFIDYGSIATTDQIGIVDQSINTIERVEVGGYYLSDSTINQAIQDMAAYATANGISFTSVEDVKANADLMNIISNSWQAA